MTEEEVHYCAECGQERGIAKKLKTILKLVSLIYGGLLHADSYGSYRNKLLDMDHDYLKKARELYPQYDPDLQNYIETKKRVDEEKKQKKEEEAIKSDTPSTNDPNAGTYWYIILFFAIAFVVIDLLFNITF